MLLCELYFFEPVEVVHILDDEKASNASYSLSNVRQTSRAFVKFVDVLKTVLQGQSLIVFGSKQLMLYIHPSECREESIEQTEVESVVDVEESHDGFREHHVDRPRDRFCQKVSGVVECGWLQLRRLADSQLLRPSS